MSLHWPGTPRVEAAGGEPKAGEPEEFVFVAPVRQAPGMGSDPLTRLRQEEQQALTGEQAHLMRLPRCLGGR